MEATQKPSARVNTRTQQSMSHKLTEGCALSRPTHQKKSLATADLVRESPVTRHVPIGDLIPRLSPLIRSWQAGCATALAFDIAEHREQGLLQNRLRRKHYEQTNRP